MSQHSTANGDDGKGKGRKVLSTGVVYCGSLPLSLRHTSPEDALKEAKEITQFLTHTVDAFSTYSIGIDAEGRRGFILVLDLLRDKLDIGSGSYKFPFLGWGDSLPALAEREGGVE